MTAVNFVQFYLIFKFYLILVAAPAYLLVARSRQRETGGRSIKQIRVIRSIGIYVAGIHRTIPVPGPGAVAGHSAVNGYGIFSCAGAVIPALVRAGLGNKRGINF